MIRSPFFSHVARRVSLGGVCLCLRGVARPTTRHVHVNGHALAAVALKTTGGHGVYHCGGVRIYCLVACGAHHMRPGGEVQALLQGRINRYLYHLGERQGRTGPLAAGSARSPRHRHGSDQDGFQQRGFCARGRTTSRAPPLTTLAQTICLSLPMSGFAANAAAYAASAAPGFCRCGRTAQ